MKVGIKFHFLCGSGETVAETVVMLWAGFKIEALARRQVYKWYLHFRYC